MIKRGIPKIKLIVFLKNPSSSRTAMGDNVGLDDTIMDEDVVATNDLGSTVTVEFITNVEP